MSDAPLTYGGVPPVRNDRFTNALRVQLQAWASRVEQVNRDNGWYDEHRTVGDGAALLHSEVSEAFDAWRKHGFADQTEPLPHLWGATHCTRCGADRETAYARGDMECGVAEPKGYGSELGDVLIRLLDQASRDGVDLAGEVARKLEYNATRGYRYGGRAV